MAAIFVLSSQRDLELPEGVSDLGAHFAGYALLGALVLRAVSGAAWSGVTLPAAARAWLISAIYGVTDEFHQQFVAGRWPSVSDWLADASGAAAAIAAIVLLARVIRGATTSAKGYGGPP
jgi:VanZ family protein